MVTAQDLISGTKRTFDNPLVEMKSIYESIVREVTTLEEKQKKVLFHSQRISTTVDNFLNSAKNITNQVNLRVFKDSYPVIMETKKKIGDLLSEIKTIIIPNLQRKVESLGALIDKNGHMMANIDEFKREVESQYQKVESAAIFIDDANKFMEDTDAKIFPHKAKARELGLDKKEVGY